MCEIAAKNMDWIQVSRWEAEQPAYVKTVNVLQHFRSIYQNSSILLVSGADLVQSFCTPNVWAPQDVRDSPGLAGKYKYKYKYADML
jgi:nicotinamide mononucleotide adenylyltransferase